MSQAGTVSQKRRSFHGCHRQVWRLGGSMIPRHVRSCPAGRNYRGFTRAQAANTRLKRARTTARALRVLGGEP